MTSLYVSNPAALTQAYIIAVHAARIYNASTFPTRWQFRIVMTLAVSWRGFEFCQSNTPVFLSSHNSGKPTDPFTHKCKGKLLLIPAASKTYTNTFIYTYSYAMFNNTFQHIITVVDRKHISNILELGCPFWVIRVSAVIALAWRCQTFRLS